MQNNVMNLSFSYSATVLLLLIMSLLSTSALRNVLLRRPTVNIIATNRQLQQHSAPLVSIRYDSTSIAAVKEIGVLDFKKILDGPDRNKYQIVDVREKSELENLSLPGGDVINLPLSEVDVWIKRVSNGEVLDPKKPVLCFCFRGARSMKASTAIVGGTAVQDVTSIVGGLEKYIAEADPSLASK